MDKYPFVHLHNHTEFSLLDGSIRINELIEKTEDHKMKATAITDHGNMFGAFSFYKHAKKKNIKPIIGCEVYITNSDDPKKDQNKDDIYHLVLLTQNNKGYHNLIDMVTKSYLEGFYYKPLIKKSYLQNRSEGLIALSACLKGEVPARIIKGYDDKNIMDLIDYYRSIFCDNRFYLEVQDNGLDLQDKVNKYLIDTGKKHNIPIIATNDVHFLNKEDWTMHNALLCIGTGKTINDQNRLSFPDTLYYKSPKEMYDSFGDVPEALINSIRIAEMCDFDFVTDIPHLPEFPIPEGHDTNSYLRELAMQGLQKKVLNNPRHESTIPHSDYKNRLDYELGIIQKLNFSGYMLIVWDIIHYCKVSKIGVGPGRGSAVGSLLCYCLDITEVDPMPFGLFFERFLNPERRSMPDIDIDICQEKRPLVIDYLSEKYGKENVAQIITFSKLTSKAAIKDVARVYELPFSKANALNKLFPDEAKDIHSALEISNEFKQATEKDEAFKEIIDISQKVEGLTRHSSVHAAGIVIADKPVSNYIPLYSVPKTQAEKNPVCTQLEYRQLEKLGLLKMDLLGLKAITLLDKTLQMIKYSLGTELKVEDIPFDDPKTFELLSSGNTTGVFQLESKGMQALLTQARPDKFEDIMPLLALYRPGPLGQKMNDVYIDGRRGKANLNYEISELEDILKDTYGVILYQEQVMKIANIIAGFSLAQADRLREAMGKKKHDIMKAMKPEFIQKAVKKGHPIKEVEGLFTKMEKFAEYGFNKSHSAGYSFITYRIAYLKANYTPYFFAALMSLDSNDKKKMLNYINDCRLFRIEIISPDINRSVEDFSVMDNKIIFGLRAIQKVGDKAVNAILKARKKINEFTDLQHFCEYVDLKKVNTGTIKNLIKSGAFDKISSHSRKELLYMVEDAMQLGQENQRNRRMGQRSLLDAVQTKTFDTKALKPKLPADYQPETQIERLNYEFESISYFISDHPISNYSDILKKLKICDIDNILDETRPDTPFDIAGVINSITPKKTRNDKLFANIAFEDMTGFCEVIVFPELYEKCRHLLKPMLPMVITGTRETQEQSETSKQSLTVLANYICPVDSFISSKIEFIDIALDYERINDRLLKDLECILSQYPGTIMPRFILKKDSKSITIRPHPNYLICFNRELLSSLKEVASNLSFKSHE